MKGGSRRPLRAHAYYTAALYGTQICTLLELSQYPPEHATFFFCASTAFGLYYRLSFDCSLVL